MSLTSDVRASLRSLDDAPARVRRSALAVGGVLLLLAAISALRAHRPWLLAAIGVLLLAAGALAPSLLRRPFRAWMALAFTLGWLVSRAALALIFLLVVTPIGLLARLAGKRFLDLRPDPSAHTYWVERPEQPARYEKMY